MSIFNGETLLAYFPAALLLLTFEIILTAYRSDTSQWTPKLALCNLVVNLLWIALLIAVVLHPNLFNPKFAPYIADLYNNSLARTTSILHFTIYSISVAFIVTNVIDIFSGFNNCNIKKKSDQF